MGEVVHAVVMGVVHVVVTVDHEEVEVDDLALRWEVDMDKVDEEVQEEVHEAHEVVQEVMIGHREEVMVAADINLYHYQVAKWTMYGVSRTNHPANKAIVHLLACNPHSLYTMTILLTLSVYGDSF